MKKQITSRRHIASSLWKGLRRQYLTGLALSLMCVIPAAAGDLTGKIVASDGRPMPNVTIDIVGIVTEGERGKTAVYSTRTTGVGDFAFRDLPDGVYTVCADKAHDYMLNPCEWGSKRHEVRISAAQRTPNIEIPVTFGRQLRVTVDDPGEALATSAAKRTPDSLVVFSVLDANGHEHEMRLDFEGKRTRDYLLTVPVDEQLQVVVNSFQADLKLAQAQQARTPLTKNHHRMNLRLSSDEKVERIVRIELAKAEKE